MNLPAILAQGGGGGGGIQWMQLLGFLLVVGLSALSWLFQKLAEAREKKKRQDMAERRKLETLRTGREAEVEEAPSSVTSRQQELAVKRQAQLEELRRRQQERARQQTQAPSPVRPRPATTRVATPRPVPTRGGSQPPPIVFIPGSSGPIVVNPRRPAPPQRTVATQRPTAAQRTAAQVSDRGKKLPQGPARQRPSTERRPQVRPERREDPQAASTSANTSHGLLSDINTRTAAAQIEGPSGPAMDLGGQLPRTAEEWRNAFIMREVLAAPLALRAPGEDPLQ